MVYTTYEINPISIYDIEFWTRKNDGKRLELGKTITLWWTNIAIENGHL